MRLGTLKIAGVVLLFWLTSVGSSRMLDRRFASPFPHFDRLILMDDGFLDAWLIAGGFRSVAADVAWMKLLQYTGGGLTEEKTPERYVLLKDYTLRVVRIDPYFYRAYVFGSSILAWFKTVNRPEEALEILREGLRADPSFWAASLYASAIVFHNKGDTYRMLGALTAAANHPDCPDSVRIILSNLYKDAGRYREAIAVWETALDMPNFHGDRELAAQQLQELFILLKRGKRS